MKANLSNRVYWILSGLFLGVYFWIIYQNTYNIPYWDDFHVFFSFLYDYIGCSSFTEKIKLVFSQHNEHRIVFTRIIVLLSYWLTGKINLTTIIIIGNLFLCGIGFMFCVFSRQKRNIGILALLIVLLLFNGQNFRTSTWAMVGLANTGTLLLAMLSVYFVMQSGRRCFITGLILSVITIFSNGNGMCLLPAVSMTFLLEKRKKELIVFAVVTGMATAAYFFHWEEPAKLELPGIGDIVTSFFLFLGGNFYLPSAKVIPVFAGLFIFVTYIIAITGKFYRKNRLWFTFFTYVLLMAAMVSFNRTLDLIPLRYRIYCCMGLLLTVMFYFENRKAFHLSRRIKFTVPPVMLFNIFCFLLYSGKEEKFSESLRISTYNWQHSRSGLLIPEPGSETILQNAEAIGIYSMPKFPPEKMVSPVGITGEKWQNYHSRISYHIDFVRETNEHFVVKGWACTNEMEMEFTHIRLWLLNEKRQILIHPYLERRYELPLDAAIQQNCGFFAVIPKSKCPQGIYKLGIDIQKRYILPVKKSIKSIETQTSVVIKGNREEGDGKRGNQN